MTQRVFVAPPSLPPIARGARERRVQPVPGERSADAFLARLAQVRKT